MKKTLSSLVLCCFCLALFAQYETVVLNYEKSYFGENQPLPAGKHFILNGMIDASVPMMEVLVYKAKGIEKSSPIYHTEWKRSPYTTAPSFSIPVNYRLREGERYDILIRYYRKMNDGEKEKISGELKSLIESYIDQSFNTSSKKLRLKFRRKKVLEGLNDLVKNHLKPYRNKTLSHFESFSAVVETKFKLVESTRLKDVGKGEERDAKIAEREAYRAQMLLELKSMILSELNPYLEGEMFILEDDLYIDNYETENLPDFIPVNVGYGGTIVSMSSNNFNYASAPYVGLSIPLGKERFSSPILANTSISFGAFLMQMDDRNSTTWTGPIFKIPTYAGIGFKPMQYIRLNLGAAFLEDTQSTGGNFGSKIQVAPMFGISAELNISVGVSR